MHYPILINYLKWLLLIVVYIFNTGCGSVKPPVEKLAVADEVIKQAEVNDAGQYAPLELRLASEKLEEAKRAMQKEDYLSAERLADQAAIDARTALVKVDSIRAQQAVDEMKRSIELLRQQIQSKPNQ